MTARDLVEVVAAALAKHAVPAWGADGKTGTCFCSEPINAERPTIHARTRALSAHQARAVLAALRKSTERALFDIEGRHHFHRDKCPCGFASARSRSQTEHITGFVRLAMDEDPEGIALVEGIMQRIGYWQPADTAEERRTALAAKKQQDKGPPPSASWRGRERSIKFRFR